MTEKCGFMRAFLIHLGHNMWCDYLPEDMDNALIGIGSPVNKGVPDTVLRCKDEYWNQVIEHLKATGMNTLVIDLGEGVVYPSHPELAITGSWSVDKLRKELARLRSMGIEPIPKLNFSTTHNGWLKHYRRQVSTPAYYRICEDLIKDIAEMFDTPRFFHVGYDEETAEHQNNSYMRFICIRKGVLWQHDFLHIIRTVEQNGMRAWTWSDYGWDHADFYEWCPKSVLMSNWYYDECYGGFELNANQTADHKRLKGFYDLEKAGFEQVPCGTNWSGWMRVKQQVGADDVIGKLVNVCRRDLKPELLKGFMIAPWAMCDTEANVQINLKGIDLFADALDK